VVSYLFARSPPPFPSGRPFPPSNRDVPLGRILITHPRPPEHRLDCPLLPPRPGTPISKPLRSFAVRFPFPKLSRMFSPQTVAFSLLISFPSKNLQNSLDFWLITTHFSPDWEEASYLSLFDCFDTSVEIAWSSLTISRTPPVTRSRATPPPSLFFFGDDDP